jgi:hypothetical protein
LFRPNFNCLDSVWPGSQIEPAVIFASRNHAQPDGVFSAPGKTDEGHLILGLLNRPF